MTNIQSADVFLGVPYNCASYALLLNILCMVNPNLKPRFVTGIFGDTHLYDNQIEAAKLQLSREPMAPPHLTISHPVKYRTLSDLPHLDFDDPIERADAFLKYIEIEMLPEHFMLRDYQSHPAIKVDMVV